MKLCVNGDGRPVCPPSKVICKECMDAITAKLEAMILQPTPERQRKASKEE